MPVPASVRIAGKTYIPGSVDRGVAVLLTAASWVLQRLPGLVVEHQRADAVRSLGEARDLEVEIRIGAPPTRRRRPQEGAGLDRLLQARGLTQEQIAEKLGIANPPLC